MQTQFTAIINGYSYESIDGDIPIPGFFICSPGFTMPHIIKVTDHIPFKFYNTTYMLVTNKWFDTNRNVNFIKMYPITYSTDPSIRSPGNIKPLPYGEDHKD